MNQEHVKTLLLKEIEEAQTLKEVLEVLSRYGSIQRTYAALLPEEVAA